MTDEGKVMHEGEGRGGRKGVLVILSNTHGRAE